MTGPWVTSNAPSVASARSCDASRTVKKILADGDRATDGGRGDLVQLAVGL